MIASWTKCESLLPPFPGFGPISVPLTLTNDQLRFRVQYAPYVSPSEVAGRCTSSITGISESYAQQREIN